MALIADKPEAVDNEQTGKLTVNSEGAGSAALTPSGQPIMASALQAATFNTPAFKNYYGTGAIFYFDITAVAGAGTLTAQLQELDPQSQKWVNVAGAVTAALGSVATTSLTVYPGVTVAANVAVSRPLARTLRFVCTIGGTSATFSIGMVGVF